MILEKYQPPAPCSPRWQAPVRFAVAVAVVVGWSFVARVESWHGCGAYKEMHQMQAVCHAPALQAAREGGLPAVLLETQAAAGLPPVWRVEGLPLSDRPRCAPALHSVPPEQPTPDLHHLQPEKALPLQGCERWSPVSELHGPWLGELRALRPRACGHPRHAPLPALHTAPCLDAGRLLRALG